MSSLGHYVLQVFLMFSLYMLCTVYVLYVSNKYWRLIICCFQSPPPTYLSFIPWHHLFPCNIAITICLERAFIVILKFLDKMSIFSVCVFCSVIKRIWHTLHYNIKFCETWSKKCSKSRFTTRSKWGHKPTYYTCMTTRFRSCVIMFYVRIPWRDIWVNTTSTFPCLYIRKDGVLCIHHVIHLWTRLYLVRGYFHHHTELNDRNLDHAMMWHKRWNENDAREKLNKKK